MISYKQLVQMNKPELMNHAKKVKQQHPTFDYDKNDHRSTLLRILNLYGHDVAKEGKFVKRWGNSNPFFREQIEFAGSLDFICDGLAIPLDQTVMNYIDEYFITLAVDNIELTFKLFIKMRIERMIRIDINAIEDKNQREQTQELISSYMTFYKVLKNMGLMITLK